MPPLGPILPPSATTMQNNKAATPPPPPPPSDRKFRPADSIPFRCCTCQATVPAGTSWHAHAASKPHRDRRRQTIPSHADLLRRWLAEKLRRRDSPPPRAAAVQQAPKVPPAPALGAAVAAAA